MEELIARSDAVLMQSSRRVRISIPEIDVIVNACRRNPIDVGW
jgi:hypothetical protein